MRFLASLGMTSTLGATSTLSVTAMLITAPLHVANAQQSTPRVRVTGGEVVGTADSGVAKFLGIPYAAPPVGANRWRAPQPVAPWKGAREAADYTASCPQPLPIRGVPPGTRVATISEDCLGLNVWAPAGLSERHPVMVWIHGGGNDEGTASRPLYDGSSFARDGIVLVSFNYRLGLLGFFAHPALTRDAGSEPTANYGVLDQLAALRWVRHNIAAFGGDTSNVTVFGESAGGEDIRALLASPLARGLFQKAIIESGGGGWGENASLAEAEATGVHAAAAMGLRGDVSAEALRALPLDTVLAATGGGITDPVVDGRLLTESPLDAIAAGRAAPVPLIIGTNSNEGSILTPGMALDRIFPLIPAALRDSLRAAYGDAARTDDGLARLAFRDGYFAGPSRWIALHRDAPTWLYRFDYVMTVLRRRAPGVAHGFELPFVFEAWDTPFVSAEDRAVAAVVHRCWVSFAENGVPACPATAGGDARGTVPWPRYTAAQQRWMVFGDSAVVTADSSAAVLDRLQRALRPGS